jgi:UDP-3-O-[3-hydroxymyristoyl] N-acetylglucosamine deacetylase
LVEPASEFEVALRVEFDGWPEGRAELAYRETQEASSIDYQRDIAPARTFAFRREVEQLLAAGLARGGSLDNALIITPPSDFSTPLRVASEWAAHKLLDLLGDFALLDARPRMRVTAVRPGHQINTMTARALLQSGVQEQKEIE